MGVLAILSTSSSRADLRSVVRGASGSARGRTSSPCVCGRWRGGSGGGGGSDVGGRAGSAVGRYPRVQAPISGGSTGPRWESTQDGGWERAKESRGGGAERPWWAGIAGGRDGCLGAGRAGRPVTPSGAGARLGARLGAGLGAGAVGRVPVSPSGAGAGAGAAGGVRVKVCPSGAGGLRAPGVSARG
jgi:hypothetical protein